jgi:hypothetical protein
MDDLTQLAQIKNNLSELKVETQKNNIESTTRDFEFIG